MFLFPFETERACASTFIVRMRMGNFRHYWRWEDTAKSCRKF